MGLIDNLRARALNALAPISEPAVRDAVSNPNNLRKTGTQQYGAATMYNMVTGQGTARDPAVYTGWKQPRTLGQDELFGMGRNGLIQQALGKLPNTATADGWRVSITDPDVPEPAECADKVAAYEERLGSRQSVSRSIYRGHQYSQSLVIMGVEDGGAFNEPVNKDTISTVRWLVVIDSRDFQASSIYQADSEHYGKVETFEITDIQGILEDGLRYGRDAVAHVDQGKLEQELEQEKTRQGGRLIVHADRVMHFATPDYLPMLDTLQDSLGAFFETTNGIRTAARESSTVVYKVGKWLRKMWSENSALSRQHMSMVDQAKGILGAWVIDKEQEDVSILSRPLGGVAKLADPFMVWIAAALAIPVTVLWGVSPGGFGKGEAERETWHATARAFQSNVLTPQLTKLHGYILAAADGCQLSYDTQREIKYADLSPPDEETVAKLRSDALSEIRQLVKDDILTRAEARAAVAALADDTFRVKLDTEIVEKPPPAPVGVITGGLQLLQSVYPGGVPLDAGRAFLQAVDPVHFTAANIEQILPSTPTGADPGVEGPDGSGLPGLEEEDDESINEGDVVWATSGQPPDAMEAGDIAEELNLRRNQSGRITRAHKRGEIKGWKVFGGKPRFSLSEVQSVVLAQNGVEPETAEGDETKVDATVAVDASEVGKLYLSLRVPDTIADQLPAKPEDTSPAHVTLIYVKDVDPEHVHGLVSLLGAVLAEQPPITVTLGELGYFDKPDGSRVAFSKVSLSVDGQALFDSLAEIAESMGAEVSRFDSYAPHMTLAYLAEGEEYEGPVPEGSWLAASAEAHHAGDTTELTMLSPES